ncbi:MAG: hypothetical protein HPY64_10920 [Anaerolineae bacterium]|nr:hypothetical protein [Anaerolineae bacterium]
MATYYPDQTTILPMTTIRRERTLPPDVIGEVTVQLDAFVSAVDVVARGTRASRYLVIDLRNALGVDDPAAIAARLHVRADQVIRKGDILAGDKKNRRTLLRAPVTGRVHSVVDGRLVLKTGLSEVIVRAGFRGVVTSVRPRGVLLETTGGLVQGVWGNGRSCLGALKMAPRGGLGVLEIEEITPDWRGAIVVSPQPLDRLALAKAEAQTLGAVIAPSMPADLRPVALKLKIPIMLTEGFGSEPMNRLAQEVLESYAGMQASLSAHEPNRWSPDRPEVIIPAQADLRPPPPARDEPLRPGAEVRIIRQPYAGTIGRVRSLPRVPQRIENGLRLPVAEVLLPSGRTVTVPLVNLELFGRG